MFYLTIPQPLLRNEKSYTYLLNVKLQFLALQMISNSVPLPLPSLWSIILNSYVYLLLLLMTCPSTGSKIVCASPNLLCHTKIYLEIVPIPIFHSPQPWPLYEKVMKKIWKII